MLSEIQVNKASITLQIVLLAEALHAGKKNLYPDCVYFSRNKTLPLP